MKIDKIKCFLLDLDGTVYIDGAPIGDMINTLKKVRESGRKIIYLTNNSSVTAEDYRRKLTGSGIFGAGDGVYTSGDATISFLNENYRGKKVFLLGTKALKSEFEASGISLSDDADIVVLAYDKEIDYKKICTAAKLLSRGALYIATHPDVNCPAKDAMLPDAGSFIALFSASTGRAPDIVIGKPHAVMADEIVRRTGLKRNEIAMVGDRLYTDMKFAVSSGFLPVLVLSGETDISAYQDSGIEAGLVLDSFNDIVKFL